MARKRGRRNHEGDTNSPSESSVGFVCRTVNRQLLDCSSRRLTRQQARAAAGEAALSATVNQIDAPASSSTHAANALVPFSLQEGSGEKEEAKLEDLVGQSANPDGKGKGSKLNDKLSSITASSPRCQTGIDNFLSTVESPSVAEPVAVSLKNATPLTLVACEHMECNQERTEASNCKYIPEQTCSYLTEMVKMLGDQDSDDDDDDEIDSDVPNRVSVQKYIIKKEYAPTVSAFLEKQGDIAEKCFLETVKIRSIFLEQVAIIIEKLKDKKFVEIKESEVTKLLADVEDIDRVNVNIEWLRSRLLKIQEVKRCLSLKLQKDADKKTIKEGKQELQQLQQRATLIIEDVMAAEARNGRIRERMKNSEADVKFFMKYTLTHDLL